MPNIAAVLKEEIARVARKELRNETEKLKKLSAQHRSDIAALKRLVAALEKKVSRLEKQAAKGAGTQEAAPPAPTKVRFSAKSLLAHRQRLGLSAPGLSTLIGVSPQSIYNWESGTTRPRQEQVIAIAELRTLNKNQAHARLKELTGA